MATTRSDIQIAALAGGFTIGFGFLTVWEAIKQTRLNKNPLRSAYIYMIWGEIVANIVIGILGWTFLDGVIGASVPTLFFILLCWVFEIQLLMQIIINRIALIAEHRSTVQKIKWGTFIVISAINVAVFCIWVPAHLSPPASQLYVDINEYWDKVSKVLILIVDAALNWYFLRTVKIRLVQQHGLVKYKPLVGFNAKLMVLSIAMDGMLIGLMFLRNQIVYIQFHPVTYMVKLNIEMSMASLVVRLARGKTENDMYEYEFEHGSSKNQLGDHDKHRNTLSAPGHMQGFKLTTATANNKSRHSTYGSDEAIEGIHCRTDVHVVHGAVDKDILQDIVEREVSTSSGEAPHSLFGDETPLYRNRVRTTEKLM